MWKKWTIPIFSTSMLRTQGLPVSSSAMALLLIPPRDPTVWKIFFRNQLYVNLVQTSLVINLEIDQPPTPLVGLW